MKKSLICVLLLLVVVIAIAIPVVCASDASYIDSQLIIESALIGLIPASILTVVEVVVLLVIHNKANQSVAAEAYLGDDRYEIDDKTEVYVRTYETVQKNFYKSDTKK